MHIRPIIKDILADFVIAYFYR